MPGSSLRWARSPVAPKITSVVGWTGTRSSPSTRGFSCSSVLVAVAIVASDLLDGVAAELVAQGRVHPCGEVGLPARGEAGVERLADHRHGDALVDRVLDGPT